MDTAVANDGHHAKPIAVVEQPDSQPQRNKIPHIMDEFRKKPTQTSVQYNPQTKHYIVDGRYRIMLRKQCGRGTFGQIYHVQDSKSTDKNESLVAKIQLNVEKKIALSHEYKVCVKLRGKIGMPKMKALALNIQLPDDNAVYSMIIMDSLGPSLMDLHLFCDRKFSLKTVCMLADQILYRIKALHDAGIVHRDIKPDNFLMGESEMVNVVYLIDFGLCKSYKRRNGEHVPYRKDGLLGTLRYCSINSHDSIQSRRDDLEAICHMLLFLLRGNLPWQNATVQGPPNSEHHHETVLRVKQNTTIEELCDSPDGHEAFGTALQYCRNLAYDATPDYRYLLRLFLTPLQSNNMAYDFVFDWHKKLEM